MKENKWLYLIVLSLFWGSSFILMKKALLGLAPVQIGALRIVFAGLVLISVSWRKLLKIEKKYWKPIALVAFLASFFPAFFFAFAVEHIDSSISAVLNSLTPLITLILGVYFFRFSFQRKQIFGVLLGLAGTLLLILQGMQSHPEQNYAYAFLIFIASIGYALGMNIVKTQLQNLDALSITAGSFLLLLFPAILVFYVSTFYIPIAWSETEFYALFYVTLLSFFGTAIAKVLFNRLVQISSPIFSSSVTYIITVVAVMWGLLDGEKINSLQFLGIGIVFLGVYMVNKKKAN